MHHKIDERGLSADYPIAYSIGYGNVGRSYLIDVNGHLFQSPAAYYTASKEWNVSPGYESERVLDFTRPITSDCLSCHAGAVKTTPIATELTALSCDRCHGPAEKHRQRPVPGTIVNPAKLTGRQRDSVCEQCHLEGATAVLNPGKYWWDFHAGERLEEVETHYVYRTAAGGLPSIAAVSQAEELALSACLRGSGGKLWCGTCHDPHGPPVNRRQQMEQICESCHAPAQLRATHSAKEDDCVACHMPRRQASDVTHAAVTDHRIMKRPGEPGNLNAATSLVAWHDPRPELVDRNLGLAYFNAARQGHSAQDFQRAYEILARLPDKEKDASVDAALGYMLLGTGQPAAAVRYFERAVGEDAGKAEYWLDLGVAQNAAGDSVSAVKSFQKSVGLGKYDYRPYQALSNLYKGIGQRAESEAAISDYLKLMPQSITMRLNRAAEAH